MPDVVFTQDESASMFDPSTLPDVPPATCGETWSRLLIRRAATVPDVPATCHLTDGESAESLVSWKDLARRAMSMAAALTERRLSGQPVLITAPPGPDFLSSLLGSWMAGAIAVPAYPPQGSRHRARLEAVRHDCQATLALGEIPLRTVDGLEFLSPSSVVDSHFDPVSSTGPCLLQYTSGSTSAPKGVILTAEALQEQLAAFHRHAGDVRFRSVLSWLPPYHDMGLVLKLLYALHAGIPLITFSPDAFVQRPARWLRAIHRYRAEMSGGPNFAFDWCVRAVTDDELAQLDLSSWKFAPTGAERIRRETLQRFARRFEPCGFDSRAFCPGYGLAEATLVVTSRPVVSPGSWKCSSRDPQQISCGAPLPGTQVRVVDPTTHLPLNEGTTGEIEVSSPSLAGGYWQQPELTSHTWVDGWLRTGDLGFLEEGELFVVGRLKDLIIREGRNIAPEDLEDAAATLNPRITAAAAFGQDSGEGERVILAVEGRELDPHALAGQVTHHTGVSIDRVLIVRPGLLPRTTSGKIRRQATRDAFLEGSLPLLHDSATDPLPTIPDDQRDRLEQVLQALRQATHRDDARPHDDLSSLAVSSIEATRFAALLHRQTGVSFDLAALFRAPSLIALAEQLPLHPHLTELPIEIGSGLASGNISHSQERMAFLHRLEPESPAYHVFGAIDLHGPIDLEAMEKSWQRLLSDHPILRTRHTDSGMHLGPPSPLEILDGDPDVLLPSWARQPFHLDREPPARAGIIACRHDHHVLAFCGHHIVVDGWSMRVIAQQLAHFYEAYRRGIDPPAKPLGPDFIDYAAWQRQRLDSGTIDHQIDYWKRSLSGHSGKLELATDFPRPTKPSWQGDVVSAPLPATLESAVAAVARAHGATPFMVRLAAWMLTLRAHGAGNDLVTAVPVANRHHAVAGELIGTLVNTLPLRITLADNDRFCDLLLRVREATFAMQAHQEAPFEKIIEAVQPERSRDRAPIAQILFDHQEYPLPLSWTPELTASPRPLHRGAVQFDLAMVSLQWPDCTQLFLEFRQDLFRRQTAQALLDRYLVLLEAACESPNAPAQPFAALTSADRQQLEILSHGPQRPHFTHTHALELIGATIARQPDAIAITTPGAHRLYRQIGARSASLATHLHRHGVQAGDRVALLIERTSDLPCVLLAVWKCGAAYVPLDPSNPPERLRLILEDQAPLLTLVSPGLESYLPLGTQAFPLLPAHFETPPDPAESFPKLSPEDPAYLLYTSGSTGRPKGVVIPHRALANFLLSMAETPGMTSGETLLAVTTVSFDISGLELFLPLVAGGTIDLVDSTTARNPSALRQRFQAADPDLMQATPATWRMLLDDGWSGSPKLRLLCGGEALDRPLADRLRPRVAAMWNLYGPTETTIWSTLWAVPPISHPAPIRIGTPIANTTLRIVSTDHQVCPPGVPGELLIGGAGLAIGYWQRPELTAERFITLDHQRFYRTGDLARWTHNGSLECLGRTDAQIKIRGFRVELGEIDAALLDHPNVQEAATVWTDDRLIAWFRSSSPIADLHDHLRRRLPDYMVPSRLLPLENFPLTPSGKIDRNRLATLPIPAADAAPDRRGTADPLLQELTRLWAETLGVPEVGPDDDFFALGGHSLLAARLATVTAERTGLSVPLDWLFDQPTPAGMAARWRSHSAPDLERPRPIPLARGRGGPPLFWIHTLVDGGMGLLPYREAALQLADLTDSYGMAEGSASFSSLRDLAAAHVESLRSLQPKGPYRLAGFCFGGNLAAEIACQLEDQGESIELLLLLEASPPQSSWHRDWWRNPTHWTRLLQRFPRRLWSLAQRDLDTVGRRIKMKQRAASSKVDSLVHRTQDIPDLRGVLDLDLLDEPSRQRALRHWEALHRHPHRLPSHGRLVLIRALDEGWLPRDPQLGWTATMPLEIHQVSGRHEEFLRHQSAGEVAAVLRKILSTPPKSGAQ